MVHGAVLSIFDARGSISLDVLAPTIGAANLRQCQAYPLTKRRCLWGRIMPLYSSNVQTYAHERMTANGTSAPNNTNYSFFVAH
jgi:hypothetical protein